MRGLIGLLLLTVGTAAADSMLIFNISPSPDSGELWYGGAETEQHLIGSVQVGSVSTLSGSIWNCWTCGLYFETGSFTGSTDNNWMFGDGFFSVLGGTDLMGNGNPNDPNNIPIWGPDGNPTALMSGTISNTVAQLISPGIPDAFGNIDATALVSADLITAAFNPRWTSFLGLPPDFAPGESVQIGFLVDVSFAPGDLFSSSGTLGGTFGGFSPAPEASSILLLSLALLTVGLAWRFRLFGAH